MYSLPNKTKHEKNVQNYYLYDFSEIKMRTPGEMSV